MIAVFIFTIVMASLYTSFRMGVKAYAIGTTHAEGEQMARYTIEQLTSDLRNVFYKQASTYNVTRRQREALQSERERQATQSGSRYDPMEDENMPELGPRIDLGFYATDSEDKDDISFVRLQTLKRPEDRKLWGFARVRYFISGEALYRSVDDIVAADVDEYGQEIPKPNPPQVDKIATHVKGMDIKFGYYYDGEWREAPDWDSNATRYRNPAEDEEQDDTIVSTASNDSTSSTQQQVPDDLPAWAKITITFTDPKNMEKDKKYIQIVQIPSSQETYLPADLLTQDPNSNSGSRDAFRSRRGRSPQ